MNNEDSLKLSMIKEEIFDPTSDLYLDNLLDLAASISYDIHCSGTWKNSKPIKSFLQRFNNFSDKILQLRVSLNDFNIIKTVGQGGFGRVDLVKHKQTKNIYAMKVMDKSTFVQNSFNGFWEERDIMAKNDSEWLIKCFYTFMDLKKLYIVMEYMPGGDLYHWMMALEDFSDEQTHFYAMEMVLAVEILHEMGFIHRDLKPDNMLLDRNGHLKLADFGTCIRVGRNGKVRTNFQVGTPDYICPEILRNTGVHDLEVGFEIDWWAFGIVIYELFYGETPFEGESTSTLYQNIMCYRNTLVYPDDKPGRPEFLEFLSRILTEPDERMNVRDIKRHSYLDGPGPYKWTFATIREHQSPVIFQVTGEDDTNFINYDPGDRRNQQFSSGLNNNNYFSGENLAFSGFTFNRHNKYGHVRATTAVAAGEGVVALSGTGTTDAGQSDAKMRELEVQRQQVAIKYDSALSELGKAQATVARLEKELADKEHWITTKRNEIAVAQDSGKAFKTKIDGLTKQHEAVQREIDQLKTTMIEKDGQIRALKLEQANSLEEVASAQAEAQMRLEKAEKLSKKIEEKSAEIARLEPFEPLLEQEKARAESLVIEVNCKSRKIAELESRLEMANTSAIPASSDSSEIERLMRENGQLESRLTELTSQLGALERDLTSERRKREDVAKVRDKLTKEVAAQKIQVGSLQSKLMSTEDQKKLLRRRINALESEKDVIEQEKRMSESIIAMKNTEIESVSAELEEKCELFERHRSELEQEKASLESQHRAVTLEHQAVCRESAERAHKLEEMQMAALEHVLVAQHLEQALHDLGRQRDVAMDLAASRDQLRADLERANKQIASDKTKITSLVSKIDDMIKNPKSMPQVVRTRLKKKDVDAAESLKKIRLLESDLQKERQKVQEKAADCNEARNECQQLQDTIRELRLALEQKQLTIDEMMRANITATGSGSVSNTTVRALPVSNDKQPHSSQETSLDVMFSPVPSSALPGTELQSLEGHIEILKKGKGRHKHVWIPSYAVLRPFRLEIFQNESGSATGTPAVSVELRSLIHVKEPSQAEWVHVDKATLPKTLQIIYEKSDAIDELRRHSVVSNAGSAGVARQVLHEEPWHGSGSRTSTMQHESSISGNSSGSSNTLSLPPSGIYNVENHSFVSMRFRSFAKCDTCQLQCSDMINPPPALECSKCKKRIHLEHIHANDKIQWCQGAFTVLLIRADTRDAKTAWMSCINKLKAYQKANEVQVSPTTFYRSVRQSTSYSPGNLNIP